MKNSFIPVNNNIDKAIAFAPSLTKSFRDKSMIKQKDHYIETLDIAQGLQNQGWHISSVCEQRGKNRKVASHFLKLEHPDFTLRKNDSKEGIANILLSNSCNGNAPLDLFLGVYRQVCSNGLIQKTPYFEHTLRHTPNTIKQIPQILAGVNKATEKVLEKFSNLKRRTLSLEEISGLANRAARLRFEKDQIDVNQLLQVNRPEDEGNDLWTVYNRIQENLTQPNRLFDRNGYVLSGVNGVRNDVKINQDLFELVEKLA